MIIVSTKEFKEKQKKYFDLAKEERIVIKRKNNFIALVTTNNPDNNFVDSEWVKNFLSIPEEYRCNPFDTSPSGDLFWADKRNIEYLKESIEKSKKQHGEGQSTICNTAEEAVKYFESL